MSPSTWRSLLMDSWRGVTPSPSSPFAAHSVLILEFGFTKQLSWHQESCRLDGPPKIPSLWIMKDTELEMMNFPFRTTDVDNLFGLMLLPFPISILLGGQGMFWDASLTSTPWELSSTWMEILSLLPITYSRTPELVSSQQPVSCHSNKQCLTLVANRSNILLLTFHLRHLTKAETLMRPTSWFYPNKFDSFNYIPSPFARIHAACVLTDWQIRSYCLVSTQDSVNDVLTNSSTALSVDQTLKRDKSSAPGRGIQPAAQRDEKITAIWLHKISSPPFINEL